MRAAALLLILSLSVTAFNQGILCVYTYSTYKLGINNKWFIPVASKVFVAVALPKIPKKKTHKKIK